MKIIIIPVIVVILSTLAYAFLPDFDTAQFPEFSQSGFNPSKDKVLMTVDKFGQLTYMDFIVESDNIGAFFNREDKDIYVNNIYFHFSDNLGYLITTNKDSEIHYLGKKLQKMDPGSLVILDKNGNLLEMRYTSSEKSDFVNPIGNAIVIYEKDKNKETYIIRNGEMKISGLIDMPFINGKGFVNDSLISLGNRNFRASDKEVIEFDGFFSATIPTTLNLEKSKINIGKDNYLGEVLTKSAKDFNLLTGKLKENANLEINGLTEINLNKIYADIKKYQATFISYLTGSTVRVNQLNIEEFLKNLKQ